MTTAPTSLTDRRPRHPLRTIGIAVLAVLVVVGIVFLALSWGERGRLGPQGGIQGSGVAATEVRTLPPFTAVDLTGSNIVTIRIGPEQTVEVEADDNLIDHVTTEVRAGELVIDQTGDFSTNYPMSVTITLPLLDDVALSGSGTMTADGVHAEALTVDLPGSGTIRISGSTDRLEATIGGSGTLFLDDLVAARATATVAGSGMIELQVSDELDASVSGSGAISYSGDPAKVTRNVTGSGAITAQ
ncbi:MAG TPA: head GIN domain-containing protein [Actinomycetota bacterium]|nr:head GIN domain-containing protein [Actinomycetota bacterium]